MNEENKKSNYITEEHLDKRFEEQTQVIIGAVDLIVSKRIKEIKDELKEVKDELKEDINNVQTLIDGYVKAQEDFKQDFVIMKEEFKQMKQIIKEKLGIEIRAI